MDVSADQQMSCKQTYVYVAVEDHLVGKTDLEHPLREETVRLEDLPLREETVRHENHPHREETARLENHPLREETVLDAHLIGSSNIKPGPLCPISAGNVGDDDRSIPMP